MKLTALTLCRNEERFIGFTARVALQWCDHLVVLLHACTDRSSNLLDEIYDQYPGRVKILISTSQDRWAEMEHRQWMLEEARALKSTHVALVDADEVLAGSGLPTIRDEVARLVPGSFLRVPMRNLCDSLETYRCEPSVWGQATTIVAVANSSSLCWRAREGYQHHHRHPMGSSESHHAILPEVLHLQMVSRKHLVAKHIWYQMMERDQYPHLPVEDIARKYSQATSRNGIQLSECPEAWLKPYRAFQQYLNPICDSGYWYLDECQRLLKKHGKAYFEGLNFHEWR